MKEWWQDRSARERSILSLGGVVVIVLLIYFILWLPVSHHVNNIKQNAIANQALLSWMQAANHAIQTHQSAKGPTQMTSASERLAVVQDSLAQVHFKKAVSKLAQTEHNDVRIEITSVNFDNLMTWLVGLWQSHGIIASQAAIKRLTDQGTVSANLVLSGKQ